MVRVTGFEPAASWSQTTRATNCATPGKSAVIIQQSPSVRKMLFPGPAGAEKRRFLRNFCLTIPILSARMLLARGGIAQLGERLNGIQEVSGSIPLISTNGNRGLWSSVFSLNRKARHNRWPLSFRSRAATGEGHGPEGMRFRVCTPLSARRYAGCQRNCRPGIFKRKEMCYTP